MNRYLYIAMIVILAGFAGLGCPAGRAASGRETGVHHADSTEPGGGTVHTTVPSGHDQPLGKPEVSLSDPLASQREAVWFKDEVPFSARVEPVGVNGSIAVLIGEGDEAVCVANLNDIGWPPDEVAQDGIWAGKLDWSRVPAPGRGQPLSFAYQRNGRTYSPSAAGTIDIVEDAVGFTGFTCTPAGEVQLTDDLEFEAVLGRGDVPGTVRVVFDDGREFPLTDEVSFDPYARRRDPQVEGQVAGDGVFNGILAVPASLPVGRPVRLHAEYLDTAGEVVATSDPVSITVLRPDIYLTEFICEPSGPVEIGALIRLKAELNKTDAAQKVNVYVEGPGLEFPVEVANFDGTEYQRGGKRLTGVWEGDFKWPYQLNKVGTEYRVFARISSGRHVISELEAPSITLLAPEVEIIDVQLSEWPVLDYLQHVSITARTSKPVRAGGLVLKVNGEKHGSLVDDGVQYISGVTSYKDVTAHDANWVGNLMWYCNPDYLEPGAGQPACVEYVINDQVFASYELEPLTVREEPVMIEKVYFRPEGPAHLGDDVEIVIELAKPCSDGTIGVYLEDETLISQLGKDLDGSRVVSRLVWNNLHGPGDYGPVIVKILQRAKPCATFTGPNLVVVDDEKPNTEDQS